MKTIKKYFYCISLTAVGIVNQTYSSGQNAYHDVQRIQTLISKESSYTDSNGAYVIKPKGSNESLKLAQIILSYVEMDVEKDAVIQAFEKNFNKLKKLESELESAKEQFKLYNDSLTFTKAFTKINQQRIDSLKAHLKVDSVNIEKLNIEFETQAEVTSESAELFFNKVQSLFGTNPFLQLADYAQSTDNAAPDKYGLISNSLKGLSGLDVSNFAQGLSQFMIERAKAELNAAFFERFKKFATDNDEIGLLFPVTTNRVSNLLSFQYPEMITQLRNAFYEDLNNLPDNMITFLQKGDDFQYLRDNNPDFIIALECMTLIRQLDYLSAPEFIKQLPDVVTEDAMNAARKANMVQKVENFKSTLLLTMIFSESVRDNLNTDDSNKRNWVSSSDFKKNILNDSTTLKIYLGLIYQQIKNDSVEFNDKKLSEEIKNNKEEVRWYTNSINELVYLVNKVDFSYKEITKLKEEDKKVGNEQIYAYINTTIEIAGFGNKFVERYADKETYKKIDDYLNITKNANDIYRYIYQEEYGSAIIATADILDILYDLNKINSGTVTKIYKVNENQLDKFKIDKDNEIKKKELIEKIKQNPLTFEKNKVRRIVFDKLESKTMPQRGTLNVDSVYIELQKEMINRGKGNQWVDDFRKYGTFMANMVEAESPEDVANVIEAAALPVGSSSIKKNSEWNIAINGYLGASRRFNKENVSNNSWNSTWAVSAPVGVTFSCGLGKGGSFSLMGVVLDVGAIVDYQLTTDEGSKIESKITLGNIFSPGGYVVYGAPFNLPISLGVGGQYGPGLSSVNTENNLTVINAPNWRWGAFLAVDIPMFNIGTGINKRK